MRTQEEVTASVLGETQRQQALRLECLKAANETAKLGLAHNVYKTAAGYLAWVRGEQLPVNDQDSLSFLMRLDELVQEFLRDERSDGRKIMNDMVEYFGKLDAMYPTPGGAHDRKEAEDLNVLGAGLRGVPAKDPFTQLDQRDGSSDFLFGGTAAEQQELAARIGLTPLSRDPVIRHAHKEIQS